MERLRDFKNHKRIVIKIGTTSLTYENGKMNLQRIDELCRVIADMANQGLEVVLVTSGAIAVGSDYLCVERPRDIVGKQATSAVGQAILMQIYHQLFSGYNRKVAQILLTKDVLEVDTRKVNTKNTIDRLIKFGIIPIVNANDTIATDELDEISDNDRLSAYVAVICDAHLLVMLSDIDGLYTDNPRANPEAKLVCRVNEITAEIRATAGGAGTNLGTGGMETKVDAARLCMDNNIDVVIAKGEFPKILWDIIKGKEIGTLFKGMQR